MNNKIDVNKLDCQTGILHYDLKKILYLFDSIRQKHFDQDPELIDEMSEKARAYAYSCSYESLFFCMEHLKDMIEDAVETSEIIRDLVEGVEENAS